MAHFISHSNMLESLGIFRGLSEKLPNSALICFSSTIYKGLWTSCGPNLPPGASTMGQTLVDAGNGGPL